MDSNNPNLLRYRGFVRWCWSLRILYLQNQSRCWNCSLGCQLWYDSNYKVLTFPCQREGHLYKVKPIWLQNRVTRSLRTVCSRSANANRCDVSDSLIRDRLVDTSVANTAFPKRTTLQRLCASLIMLDEVIDAGEVIFLGQGERYWRSADDDWVGSDTQSKEERGKEG